MKPKSNATLGLVASCTLLCGMSGAHGAEPLYHWNFNASDGANAGTGTGGALIANVGAGVTTGSFSQTGVSGSGWDKCLGTSNGHDHWWGDQKGNASATGDLDLSTVNQFTITMWIKRSGHNNNDLFSIGSTAAPVSSSNPGISVGMNGFWDNGIRVGVNGCNGWVGDLWGAGYTSDWVFLAIAYDGTDTVDVWNNELMNGLYGQNRHLAVITGGLSSSATVATGMNLHTGDWWTPAGNVSLGSSATAFLGTDGNTANGFSGNVDDVRIYNSLLTVEEIEAIRQSAFAEPLPPIDLYWKGGDANATWTSPNWTPDIEGNGTPVGLTTSGLGVAFATAGAGNLFNQLGADQSVRSIVVTAGSGPVDIGGTHNLTIGADGIWQELTAGELSISTTGDVVLDENQAWKNKSPNPLTVYSSLSGTGTLTKSGTGLLQLLADNSAFTGGIILDQGSISIAHANSLGGASASLTMNGGSLDLNGLSVSLGALSGNGGPFTNSSSDPATLTINNETSSNYGGGINDGAGSVSLVKTGSGPLTLGGTGNFSGNVTLQSGAVTANSFAGGAPTNTNFGNAQIPGRTITVESTASLFFGSNDILGGGAANMAALPTIVLNGTTLDSTRYNQLGNLTLNGATLTQSSTEGGNYHGWQFKGEVSVTGSAPSFIQSGNGRANHLSADTVFTVADVTGDAAADLTVSNPLMDQSGNFGNAPGGLSKWGAGTMKLDGTNSYTGTTKVLEGVLSMTSPTLSDTAFVEIATDAVLDLSHTGTDAVAGLKIGPTRKVAGIYGAMDSELAPEFKLAQITGSGFLEVLPDPFLPWIASFTTLSGADAEKGADPDHDGLTNLEEFGLDGNPEDGTATGKVRARVETVGGNQALVITLPVRNGASFTGTAPAIASLAVEEIDYEIGGSNDLLDFNQNVSEVVPALTGTPDMPAVNTGWTYRTFRLDGAVGGGTPRGPIGFLRANVTATPTP